MKTYRELLEKMNKRQLAFIANKVRGDENIIKQQGGDALKLAMQFIASQLVNDETSSDKEMLAHLVKELSGDYYKGSGIDKKILRRIIKKLRLKVIKSPLMQTADIYQMIIGEM